MDTKTTIRPCIKHWIDAFIRSEYVENLSNERDSDFINEPERASRCADAAEFGCDGKTYAEVINDWRDAFKYFLKDRPSRFMDLDRFETQVCRYFDEIETWHDNNGSLWEEIG